ncbi:hypothetical protein MHYP_G00051890 [Metynnis hypsauchen]
MMKSFSLAPVCEDGEGDDTAVRPSSTFRMLNFFIFPPGSVDTTEDGAPETRLPGKDEDEEKEEGPRPLPSATPGCFKAPHTRLRAIGFERAPGIT